MKNTIWVQLEAAPDNEISARWCLSDHTGDALRSGTFADFTSWLQSPQSASNDVLRAVLLLSGEQVVSKSVDFSANEKKHLQKLLPFMLESQLAVDLAQVHVAHLLADDKKTDQTALVAYTDRKQLQWRINTLELLGLEVESIVSIPALLPVINNSWSLLLDADVCHLRAGKFLCASVEPELLALLLQSVLDTVVTDSAESGSLPATLTVFVQDTDYDNAPAQTVLQLLAEHSGIKAAEIRIVQHRLVNPWSCLDNKNKHAVNLRQGKFSAPLRVGKYWRQWRVPVIAAVLAFTAVLVITLIETQINQYRFKALESRIEQRYREVMPEGVLVDAVPQLSAQISQRRSAGSAQSLISMLDAMLQPFENAENLNLHRLSYNTNNQTGAGVAEIQMNISADSTAEILQLSENLNAAGWRTQAQNISRAGERQQASLLIRGNAL